MSKPNCAQCIFQQGIPGDCHVSCHHPKMQPLHDNPYSAVLIFGKVPIDTKAERQLGLVADSHGIQNGWCVFPYNYDPIWLNGECQGFQKKDEK